MDNYEIRISLNKSQFLKLKKEIAQQFKTDLNEESQNGYDLGLEVTGMGFDSLTFKGYNQTDIGEVEWGFYTNNKKLGGNDE